ncbi:hypothetical protein [Dermatobacter hominis]|uniref:hypothetical protein n=1 Tax=Dermatobacter hominis TaxID=2884263 RepID=UPI001D11C41E|nr:hypothetical protein [Dermatobacter hominis]UDY35763.1 hypothetical protein LH044_20870 [Dermatobacter hominis]
MKAMEEPEGSGGSGALRRWGPLVAVVVVVAVVVGFLITRGGDDEDDVAAGSTTTSPSGQTQLPEGVVSFSSAEADGTVEDIDWGERCDTDTGVLALPIFPAPECYKPFTGDNGGETATGVTADTIKIVVYLPQENDPILSFIYKQVGNTDTPTQLFESYQGFNELLSTYYETYGRKVELIRYNATGTIQDEVAATSDAETIARDIQPFAVISGPALTEAFADTLAQNKVACVTCTPGQPNQWYVDRAPYVWDIQKNTDQNLQMVAEYIGKRVANRKAQYGGDEVNGKDRKLGLVFLVSSPQSEELRQQFVSNLEDEYDATIAETATYTDPVALAGQAGAIMAKMKSQGITTVIFQGDPLAPQTLTKNATEQGFFPEWVVTGSALVDTTIFSRTYDQQQWGHAFGPSNLFARSSGEVSGPTFLYDWFYGQDPPAAQVALILPNIQFFYSAFQGIGPNLTHESFQNALFGAPIVKSTVLTPQLSWGNRDIWPATDYAGIDDQTEIFWEPDATGVDELDKQGTGMWAYVDGGKRYLPGQWPEGEAQVFGDAPDPVTFYSELPEGYTLPTYTPLKPPG